jgi:(S)-mandelate dehydrogenase
MWNQRGVSDACSIDELRSLAKQRLPKGIFDFFDGAAEDEISLKENIEAFRRLKLVPRPLVDVSSVDPSTTI